MNRRKLFQNLVAFCAAAAMPFPAGMESLPESDLLKHLLRMKADLINLMIHPPVVIDPVTQTFYPIPLDPHRELLVHLNSLITLVNDL